MNNAKTEITCIEEVVEQAYSEQVQQLNDLQLAMVGGGGGDVVFA